MSEVLTGVAFGFALFCLILLLRVDRHFWFGETREVQARVVGHREPLSKERSDRRAIFAFRAEGREWEVVNPLFGGAQPQEGATARLTYPVGRPDLACVPHPWLRGLAYAALLYMAGVTGGLLMGWIAR